MTKRVSMAAGLCFLIALAWAMSATMTGCSSSSPTIVNPELTVDRVVDQFGNDRNVDTTDLTSLPVGWKVRVRSSESLLGVKASAYDSRATMTFGTYPTNPTVGDGAYVGGVYYCYNQNYRWTRATLLPGACSITKDGASAAWVTFAATTKPMAVVVVATYQNQTMGMPIVIGVDPTAKPSMSFPAVTTIIVGQLYIIDVTGNISWVLPGQGVGLYTVYNKVTVLIGTLYMNNSNQLVVVFNQNMADIIASIPAGESVTLTVTFTIDGVTYSFTVTVTGTGGSSTDTTGPTVVVSGLANGTTVSGTVPVTVSASDPSGIASIVIRIDNVVVGSGSSPYPFNWVTTNWTDGTHTVIITVTDGAGNTTTNTYVVTTYNSGGVVVPIS